MLRFDTNLQHNNDEISKKTFETGKACTNSLIEHITHETAEISNVQKRITDLNVEAQSATEPTSPNIQDSAVSYLDNSEQPQNHPDAWD